VNVSPMRRILTMPLPCEDATVSFVKMLDGTTISNNPKRFSATVNYQIRRY